MAVDIRCVVSCSLGTVVRGSVNDDYVQGTGLIKCNGSVVIADVITPAIGTAVTISYTKGGTTRQIPRKLRVLSSFADPFRGTTAVELGCKLTYLQDKRDAINWTAFDDPENTLTQSDAEIITLPITARSVATKCLLELGISSSGLNLFNQFSIAKFDLSAGYVSVLSDLLYSESRCGYLNQNELLVVFSLNPQGGTGPAFDATQLVDIAKIGVGQLPGEAVTVSYSTLKLKGEVQQTRPKKWEQQITNQASTVTLSYVPPGGTASATKVYNVLQTTNLQTYYIELLTTKLETLRLVSRRVETFTSSTAKEAGAWLQQYLSAGLVAIDSPVIKTTTTTFTYDRDGNAVREDRITEGALAFAAGALSLPVVFPDGSYISIDPSVTVQLDRVVIDTLTLGSVQQVTTTTYAPWWSDQNGQQAVAQSRDSITTTTDALNWLDAVVKAGLSIVSTDIQTVATAEPVGLPSTAQVNNQAAANGGDPNNDYRVESTSQLELAVGSATAQRRIELSLPYAPDDVFYKSGSSYGSTPSDAEQKATLFGRVQNRLLLGNRNGMNIQLAPELMPTAPFAPFTITATGTTAQYRTNGTSWTFDASGMVVATDALFWGGVGGTFASRWFPVAPGITTLPTTPPVVDGQMTVVDVVPVANETMQLAATVTTGINITSLPYALQLLTALPLNTKTRCNVGTALLLRTRTLCSVTYPPQTTTALSIVTKTKCTVALANTFTTTSQPGSTYTSGTTLISISGLTDGNNYGSVNDGTQTVTFGSSLTKATVPSTWGSWGSPPDTESGTPHVLYLIGDSPSTVTLTLSTGCDIFGIELMPANDDATYQFTVNFYDSGSTLLGSITRSPNGNAGALLFAATITGAPIASVQISNDTNTAGGFAIAQIRYSL